MRESELIGLSWDCIDFGRNEIHLYRQLKRSTKKGEPYTFTLLKNKQSRKFKPPSTVMETLAKQKVKQPELRLVAGTAWSNKDDLVFTNNVGKYICAPTLRSHFKKIVSEIGLPEARFHDLRHH